MFHFTYILNLKKRIKTLCFYPLFFLNLSFLIFYFPVEAGFDSGYIDEILSNA